jgi:mono/diheme cytochrome c family protein
MAILAAGVGFSIRAGILGQWAEQYGFTQTELGAITGGGLTGFGIIILLSSLIADRIGFGPLMFAAFVMHLVSAALTLATGAAYEAGDVAGGARDLDRAVPIARRRDPALFQASRLVEMLMAGFGGNMVNYPLKPIHAASKYDNEGRIIAFRLDGGAVPLPADLVREPFPEPPPHEGSPARIAAGEVLYNRYCSRCHQLGPGILPDLRRLSAAKHSIFYDIVLGGLLKAKGMAQWDDVLSRPDAEAIHAYLVDEGWKAFEAERAGH